MTHQELDDLFRANSERSDFQPEVGEWEEMTTILDAADRRELVGKWVSGAWITLFVGLIALGIYGITEFANADPVLRTTVGQQVDDTQPHAANLNAQAALSTGIAGGPSSASAKTSLSPITTEGASQTVVLQPQKTEENRRVVLSSSTTNVQADPQAERLGTVAVASSSSSSSSSTPSGSNPEISDIKEALDVSERVAVSPTESISSTAVVEDVSIIPAPLAVDPSNGAQGKVAGAIHGLGKDPVAAAREEALSVEPTAFPVAKSAKEISATGELYTPTQALSLPNLLLVDQLSTRTYQGPTFTATKPAPALWKVSIGALIAREVTSVELAGSTDSGTRFGLMAHVSPWRRVSVDAGISYASKDYVATERAYNPENTGHIGYWDGAAGGHQAERASVECRTWEFPLAVSYFFAGRDKPSAFVSLGATGYLITREEVDFQYAPGVVSTHHNDDVSDFNEFTPLGFAQAQVGYRFARPNGPAWRIGPYVQVPLSGVGVGAVNLYTGGVQFELELGW